MELLNETTYSENEYKNTFYNHFLKCNAGSDELRRLVKEYGERSGFYELCNSYMRIVLNIWPVIKQTLSPVEFRKEDVDNAIEHTISFYQKNGFRDFEGLMEGIYFVKQLAFDPREVDGGSIRDYGEDRKVNTRTSVDIITPSDILNKRWDEIKNQVIERIG